LIGWHTILFIKNYKTLLMTGIDEIEFIPVKKILRKKQLFVTDGFSRPDIKVGKRFSEQTFSKTVTENKPVDDIPFEKWIMPPQPQAYIKCYGNDFL